MKLLASSFVRTLLLLTLFLLVWYVSVFAVRTQRALQRRDATATE